MLEVAKPTLISLNAETLPSAACHGSIDRSTPENNSRGCILEELLLSRSIGDHGNQVGHIRMASIRLEFTEDWTNRLDKYIKTYTVY
jgi:hypothetical protein